MAAPSRTGGPYAFTTVQADGAPVRWNPCAPIHVVLNLAEAPANARGDLTHALALVTNATGIQFAIDGTTTEVPSADRPLNQSAYPGRHAPVLIAWTRPSESNVFAGQSPNTLADTSLSYLPGQGGDAYVSGEMAINAVATAGLAPGFGAGRPLGLLLLHELGHMMGLAHVSDPNQVMYPDLMPMPAAAYAGGDLAGLARVGQGAGCLVPR